MGWPSPSFPPNVEYGPQLACAEPDSVRVVWRTLAPVRSAIEMRGAGETEWRRFAAGETPGRDHDIRIDGLAPGEDHEYRLLHDAIVVAGPYRIRRRERDETTFVVFGDSGSGGPHQYAVARQIAAADPEFVLHTGDLAYDLGRRREAIRRYFVPYAPLLATRPFYVTWGNHDYMFEDGVPLRAMFRMPAPNYYAFDWGGARFYSLDSNIDFTPGSPQYAWFVADLEESPRRRRFAFFHHAPYSGSPYARTFAKLTTLVREHLCPLFETYGFEMVFNGHVHGYERAEPTRGKPVYIVTGGGGKRLNRPGRAEWTRVYEQQWHLCVVTMTKDGVTLRAINEAGEQIDRYPPLPGS